MTKYKKKILEIINCSYNHLHAQEVYEIIKKEMPDIVLATVYNNLNALVEEGLIARLTIEGEIDRFDKITRHDHLVCRKCGKLSDILLTDFTDKFKSETGIEICGYDLKVFYICDECKTKDLGK